MPMVSWFAMWIGLKMKTSARAIITAVAGLVLWLATPPLLVLLWIIVVNRGRDNDALLFPMLLSPATILPFNEFHEWRAFGTSPWAPIIINFTFHGGMWFLFRYLCLSRADKYLGRVTARGGALRRGVEPAKA